MSKLTTIFAKAGESKWIPDSVTQFLGKGILEIKKDSPHILFAVGLAGAVTSTVLACRATLKLSNTLDEIQNDVSNMKELKHSVQSKETKEYPVEQYHKDTIYVYTKATVKIVRLYGPSIIVGAVSVGALSGAHIQLTRRNAALMSAYAALDKAYRDYRDRVRARLGEKEELDIYHAATVDTIKNEFNEKEEVRTVDPNRWSTYAVFFDEYNDNWNKDSELNRIFVQVQQNWANNILHARGHLFLNEVYDMLGVPRSKAGAVVGWRMGKEGDGYVDFGIFDAFNSAFVNRMERSIILDFNVDGVIYDKFEDQDVC